VTHGSIGLLAEVRDVTGPDPTWTVLLGMAMVPAIGILLWLVHARAALRGERWHSALLPFLGIPACIVLSYAVYAFAVPRSGPDEPGFRRVDLWFFGNIFTGLLTALVLVVPEMVLQTVIERRARTAARSTPE
jgi:hypothetical protein